MFDLLVKYGPNGTVVKNGYQYQGLMVNNQPTSGDVYLGWWNNKAYENILPPTNRVVNFWYYPDYVTSYFPSDPENLLTWIKDNNVSVGWWEWAPASHNGGGDINNMILVCKDGGFPGNCTA